jgi:hypothetical protein
MCFHFWGRKSRSNIWILHVTKEEVIKNISTRGVDKCSMKEANCYESGEWGVHIVVFVEAIFFRMGMDNNSITFAYFAEVTF